MFILVLFVNSEKLEKVCQKSLGKCTNSYKKLHTKKSKSCVAILKALEIMSPWKPLN